MRRFLLFFTMTLVIIAAALVFADRLRSSADDDDPLSANSISLAESMDDSLIGEADQEEHPCPEDPQDCFMQAMELADAPDFQESYLMRMAELFEISCNGGFAVACQDRAVMAEEGVGQIPDPELASEYFQKGCDLGHMAACDGLRLVEAANTPRGPELWQQRCSEEFVEDCIQLGLFVEGGGELEDGRSAEQIFEAACEEVGAEACYWLARHLDRVAGGVDDDTLDHLYSRACDADMGRACSTLARRLDARGDDAPGLESIIERSCELQDAHGCYHLGLFRLRHENEVAAIDAWQQGCDLWHGESCDHLGQMLVEDQHQQEDTNPGQYFERGCRLNVASACYNFAVYLNLNNSPPPFERSRGLLDQACQGDHLLACTFLANMMQNGQGGPADPARALELRHKACEGGIESACARLR